MADGEDAGRVYYDTAAGDNGPPAGGKRRLIRDGGPASRVSGHVRPRDTPGWECPHDDVGIRPRMGTMQMSEDRVPSTNIESPYGGGVSSLPSATGSLLPVKFPAAPVLLADGPQLGSWQVAVVQVDETPAWDASGWECPRAEQNRQRPMDISEVTGNVRPVVYRLGALPWLV